MTYTLLTTLAGTVVIRCELCGAVSASAGDIQNKYCGRCHLFHESVHDYLEGDEFRALVPDSRRCGRDMGDGFVCVLWKGHEVGCSGQRAAAGRAEVTPEKERYMPIDAELRPCPFCGGPAVLTNVRESNHTFIVGCYNESCVRPRTDGFGAKEDVIGLWNCRPVCAVCERPVAKEGAVV